MGDQACRAVQPGSPSGGGTAGGGTSGGGTSGSGTAGGGTAGGGDPPPGLPTDVRIPLRFYPLHYNVELQPLMYRSVSTP